MEDFINKLPKIELHAHLNGSLSDKTLLKLIELRKKTCPDYESSSLINFSNFRSLSECFDVFKVAHDLVDCIEAVKLATECVIDEFSAENVVYLELRSTPRQTEQMSKQECLQTIVDTITLCQKSHPNIIVKFFPSINISYGTEEASENFALFSELRKEHPEVVRGIDLGGDPTKGKFSDYKHIFEKARSEGFRLALHCGEVVDDQGIVDMLMFMTKDDRIGHGTFIDESNPEAWRLLIEKKIPVEICLTSNVLCKTSPSYEDHHITRLLKMNHPLMICTDDCGVFKTTLSNELRICAETFKLREDDIVRLTVNANRYSFASDLERQLIDDKIRDFQRVSSSPELPGTN